MRTFVWILGLVLLAGCSDDASDPIEPRDDPPATDAPGDGMDDASDDEEAFEPVYINGTLSQNIADCSDPTGMAAGGSSHDLPEGASDRSYEVTIVSAGDVPTESICVSIDGTGTSASGTIPDGAATITVGGDFAVGTAYSIYIY